MNTLNPADVFFSSMLPSDNLMLSIEYATNHSVNVVYDLSTYTPLSNCDIAHLLRTRRSITEVKTFGITKQGSKD